jgi:hypothetical protein
LASFGKYLPLFLLLSVRFCETVHVTCKTFTVQESVLQSQDFEILNLFISKYGIISINDNLSTSVSDSSFLCFFVDADNKMTTVSEETQVAIEDISTPRVHRPLFVKGNIPRKFIHF